MTDWTDINPILAFAIKAPITFEYGRAWYNNPIAIAEGAPNAPRIAIDVNGQTAIATDEMGTDRVLRPDGTGSVVWGPEGALNGARAYWTGMSCSGATDSMGDDAGSNHDTYRISESNGEFTIQDAGVYIIKAVWTNGGGSKTARLEKNGSTAPGTSTYSATGDYLIPLALAAGDVIRVKTTGIGGTIQGSLFLVRV